VCPSGTTEYNGSCYSCSSGTLYNNTQCQIVSGTTGNGIYSYYGSAYSYAATPTTRQCTQSNVNDMSNPCLYVGECSPGGTSAVYCLRTCDQGGAQSSPSSSTCYLCPSGTVNGPNPSTGSGSIASCYAEGTQPAYTYTNATVSSKTTPNAGTYPNCNYGVTVFSTTSYNASSQVISGGTYPNCCCGSSSSTSTTTVSGGTWPNCNYTVSTSSATNQGAATIITSSGGTYPNCCCGSSSSTSTAAAVAGYPTCGCLANTASRINTGGGVAVTPTATATGDRVVTNGSASALLASAPTRLTAVTSAAGSWTVYAYNSSGTQIYTTTGSGTPAGNYGIFLGTSTLSIGTGVDNFSVS
jgi:hypothetical protein